VGGPPAHHDGRLIALLVLAKTVTVMSGRMGRFSVGAISAAENRPLEE
jgi:hypothetical protein